jgi:hypothetical protein
MAAKIEHHYTLREAAEIISGRTALHITYDIVRMRLQRDAARAQPTCPARFVYLRKSARHPFPIRCIAEGKQLELLQTWLLQNT